MSILAKEPAFEPLLALRTLEEHIEAQQGWIEKLMQLVADLVRDLGQQPSSATPQSQAAAPQNEAAVPQSQEVARGLLPPVLATLTSNKAHSCAQKAIAGSCTQKATSSCRAANPSSRAAIPSSRAEATTQLFCVLVKCSPWLILYLSFSVTIDHHIPSR